MAGNIKGITIEFRGDTTKLDKALRQINSETRAIDKELKQVDKALKFNPTSVDLWRQKQQLLTQKVNETKEKLELLKNEQARMDAEGVDKNSQEYRELQREIIATESKVKTFEGQLKKIGNVNLKAVSEQFKEMGSKLESAGRAMQGISMAAGALAASLGAVAVKSGAWADDLNTMSKQYSIGTRDLQKYAAAADLVDVSVETIAKSHVKLEKNMLSASNGSKNQAEAFDKLGVAYKNSDGSLRDSEEVFNDVITALGKMDNETERDAYAMQILGKSATELNPLIEDNGETYKRVSETFEKYGLDYIDQETLDQANEFNDQLDTIKAIGLITFQSIGAQLAGYLAPALEKVVGWVGKLSQWLSGLSPQVLTVIGVIASLLAVTAPLLIGLGKLATGIGAIINLANTLGIGIGALASPIGIAIAAIVAIIAIGVLLYKNWDTIKAKALQLWTSIKTTFANIKTSITTAINSVKSFLSGAWSSIKSTASSAWQAVKNAIVTPIQNARDKVKGAIDKIKGFFPLKIGKIFSGMKLPHFNVNGGKSPFGIGGKGSPPSISVSWYDKGGIFDSPTIIGVGEKRPEFVGALDDLRKIVREESGGSGLPPIVVNVYGGDEKKAREIAEEAVDILIKRENRRRLAWT